jgi:hypothetical protein
MDSTLVFPWCFQPLCRFEVLDSPLARELLHRSEKLVTLLKGQMLQSGDARWPTSQASTGLPGEMLGQAQAYWALEDVCSNLSAFQKALTDLCGNVVKREINTPFRWPADSQIAQRALYLLRTQRSLTEGHRLFQELKTHWQKRAEEMEASPSVKKHIVPGLLDASGKKRLLQATFDGIDQWELLRQILLQWVGQRTTKHWESRIAMPDLDWTTLENSQQALASLTSLSAALAQSSCHEARHAVLKMDVAQGLVHLERLISQGKLVFKAVLQAEHEHFSTPRTAPFSLMNQAYLKALENHLLGEGMHPDDIGRSLKNVFEYAQKTQSLISELLDDEMLTHSENISLEALRVARLRVKFDDPHYPLSVAARNSFLELTTPEGLGTDLTPSVAPASVSFSPSSSGASS